MNKQQIFLKKVVLLAMAVTFVVITLGAFTRLVHAGLGCPDWPGCYGHLLWPDTPEEIAIANETWVDAPVELDKTWPEMVHRYFASSLGLFAVFILFYSVKNRKVLSITPVLPSIILGAVILQGMFGMWTVTLKLWPQVVTGHLLGGFTVLSLFWLLFLKLRTQVQSISKADTQAAKPLLAWLAFALVVVVLQMALGGWTTSNYAAVACPDLPTCQNQWWPEMDFSQGFNFFQHIGPNYLGGHLDNAARIAIHMSHRIGAIITVLVLLFVGVRVLKSNISALRLKVFAVWGVLFVQVVLGLSNIVFDFPVAVAVAHNAVGALLLMKVIALYFANYQYTKKPV